MIESLQTDSGTSSRVLLRGDQRFNAIRDEFTALLAPALHTKEHGAPSAVPDQTGEEVNTMATLPEQLRAEQARCIRLMQDFDDIGSAGAFARALISEAVRAADDALHLGNPEAMTKSLESLRRFQPVLPDQPRFGAASRRFAGYRPPAAPVWQVAPPAWQVAPMREQFFTWTQRVA